MATFSATIVNIPLCYSSRTQFPIQFHAFPPLSLSISSLTNFSISCSMKSTNLVAYQKKPTLLKTIKEGAGVLLLGSFLFFCGHAGRLSPALADDLKSGVSGSVEEKIETQKTKGEEDDDLYAKLLESNPDNIDALKMSLYVKMKKGKRVEAVKYLERLVALEPEEVEWRLLQALSYDLMGKVGKSKRLFMNVLKERPLQLRALHGLALAMLKTNESRAAFEMLQKALKLAQSEKRLSEERSIKILIAQMHVVKGDLEEALEQFEDLINEDPRDFRPHLCQGIIYSLLDKKKEANEQFEIYHSLIPDEFPQRDFIDEVILSAKTEAHQLRKEIQLEDN
ncbi:hypothetical protein HPP92_021784 [Vanilla planifolia]|uniref:Chloroplast lumen common family protein n=2 Tax=Vanilla planifolia TaxID=51239 RepID=A0A835Q500_VANPL|nr:hypothetical protein HPP92_021784 [Vanilla planifolia]